MATIRLAKGNEIDAIREFIFAHGVNEWNYLAEDELDPHLAGIGNGETIGLVAEEDGRVVGIATCGQTDEFAGYDSDQESRGYVSEVVVAKDRCGRGIGTLLLNECKRVLRERGMTVIYVERHEENAASAGMMRKAGFQVMEVFDDLARRSTGSRRTAVSRFVC